MEWEVESMTARVVNVGSGGTIHKRFQGGSDDENNESDKAGGGGDGGDC